MKEIIDKILEEEKKAEAIVEQARQDAREMKIKAEKEAEELISESRRQAAVQYKKIIEEARKKAGKDREAELEAVKNANETLIKSDLDKLVNRAFKRLLGSEAAD